MNQSHTLEMEKENMINPKYLKPFLTLVSLLTALLLCLPLSQAASTKKAKSAEKKPASSEKKIVIPRLTGSVSLDGQTNEEVWKKAARISKFLTNEGQKPVTESTEVLLWYDDNNLYLAWTCQDSDVQATYTARDSKLWEEEVVELFITPEELTQYFELQWNPLGTTFDAIIKNQLGPDGFSEKMEGDWDFTAKGMNSAVFVQGTVQNPADKDQQWIVEVQVPFSALGRSTPQKGEKWRGNLFRYSRTGDQVELQSWSPTERPSFHEPSRFGTLEFGDTPKK